MFPALPLVQALPLVHALHPKWYRIPPLPTRWYVRTQFEPAYQAGGIVDRIHFQIRHKRLQLRKAAKQVINIGEVVSGIEQNTKFDSELNRWKYPDYHLVLVG